jgi:SAM-dependent methyltransferase
VSAFESWDPRGRAFDAVAAGQAWHWVDPVAGASKAAETLRPGGRLAVFWNAAQPPASLSEEFASVYRRVIPESLAARQASFSAVEAYSHLCGKAGDGMRDTGSFAEPEQWRFDWERTYTRDEWLDQLPTQGDHSQFPADVLAEVLEGVGAVIDAAGGSFPVLYSALVETAVRL